MPNATRRTFLTAAGSSAAAAAAVAAAPGALAAGSPGPDPQPGPADGPHADRVVAYVADARSGRVTVMHGEDEVTVHDADLVRRLTSIARG